MRCPKCKVDNPAEVTQCGMCGAALVARRSKRRAGAGESDTPFGGPIAPANRFATWAYRFAVLGMIPGLGLILGPIVLVWGVLARLRGRRNPAFTARALANAAIILGVLNSLTNWLGLWLMLRGLLE